MKHPSITSLLLALLGLVGTSLPAADNIPALISYQGRLADGDGNPLGAPTPVNRKMIFSLFDDPDEGSRVWTEQQNVTIANGQFSALLGNGVAVGSLSHESLAKVFASSGGNFYLEIIVDTGNGEISIANTSEDPPIKPRQRIITTAYAFRALTTDGITPGSDLRFLAADNPANSDQGLGYYDSSRQFDSVAINGPVLFGTSGGALGTVNGSTRNLALSWLANGNVGIGVHPPTERLDVAGNVLASGSLILGSGLNIGGSLTTTGIVSGASLSSTGAITGTTLIGSSLSIKPSPSDPEVAGFSTTGALTITNGGTILGPVGNVLNINSQGHISIKDLEVTESVTVPPAGAAAVPQVLATNRRLVLGGATGWGDSVAATQAVPAGGINNATGIRLILTGTNAASDLVGFGLQPTNAPFAIVPPTGEFQWFAGLDQIMSLTASSGLLTARQIKSTGANSRIAIAGSNSARLLLTQTRANTSDTRDLALSLFSDSSANLGWLTDDGDTLIPLLHFLFTGADTQLSDQVPSMGYVGVNTNRPRAPLHVKQVKDYDQNTNNIFFSGDASQRSNFGIYFGTDGGLADFNGVSSTLGDNATLRYESITALFDGEIMTNRNWYGQHLDASSDARAKHILGRSDTAKDLDLLMKIEVTDYHWIDRTVDQHRPHKRLIAQQVEKIFPQAVSIAPRPQTIPSVYEMAENLEHDAAAGSLTVTTKKPHDFKAGDLVDLYGEKTELKETPVKAVLDAHRFVIQCTQPPESLFVYGKQVSDFHTVDYDAVSMLNLSATQELKKRRDALAEENARLREKLESEAARLAALEASQKTDEAKFAALEALIERAERKPAGIKSASIPSR